MGIHTKTRVVKLIPLNDISQTLAFHFCLNIFKSSQWVNLSTQKSMLEQIKWELSKHSKPEEKKWLFFSLFDVNGKLLTSNGTVETDKTINELTDLIYNGLLAKHEHTTKTVVIDIIESYFQETDINKLLSLPTKDYGVFLVNNETKKSWAILPNTKGVTDIKTALTLIKQKYGISGNVSMYSFRTERITIGL